MDVRNNESRSSDQTATMIRKLIKQHGLREQNNYWRFRFMANMRQEVLDNVGIQ